jgi:hypothetical protein
MIKFTPTDFEFGRIVLGKPSNQKFTLTNFNVELPTKIQFNKIVGC